MKMIAYTRFNPIKCILILALSMIASGLFAQAKLSVQGLLKKSDGTALPDGNYDLKFRFYDAETGGALVGTVDVMSVEINGGVYSAILEPAGLTFATPYYVTVAVDNGTELLPRIALSAAPYALSLQGQNNKFPSIGTVQVDAITVAGAVNAGSVTASGAVSGNTVSATGTVSGASVSATGAVSGASVSATGAVNGASVSASGIVSGNNMVVPGGAPSAGVAGKGYSFGAGGDQDGGLFSLADNNVCIYANAVKALEASNGGVIVPGYMRSGGSYTFANDDNSGLYRTSDGVVEIFSKGSSKLAVTSNSVVIGPRLFLGDVPNNVDGHNLEWNPPGKGSGDYMVSINTSTRRFKHNIVPLKEDFSQILHLEPKRYTRTSDPSGPSEIGYIAEEVDSLGMKCLVLYEDAGNKIPLSINYKKMVLYTNEIVKMHQADIEKLKAEVAALTTEKNALNAENASLRADLQNQQADLGKQLNEISRRLRSLEAAASNR